MNVLISLRSEILKTRRTSAFYLAMIAGAFGPFMTFLDLVLDGIEPGDRGILLNKMFTGKFQMTAFLMLPMFIMLVSTLLPQIEYRNNTWKQVLTSPQSKGRIFVTKFISIQLLIVLFVVTNKLCMFVAAVILHFKDPSLNLLNQPIQGYEILLTVINAYLAMLAICAIQFWMGLRFRNFIAPIGIGLALWFGGSILLLSLNSEFAIYFPYSYHVYASFPQFRSQLNTVEWYSLGYAAIFLVIGFLDFKRRRMNG